MFLIKIIKNKIEFKKLKKEELCLEEILDSRTEYNAFLRNEYGENGSEYDEIGEKYSEVTDRIEELENIYKKSCLKKLSYLTRG